MIHWKLPRYDDSELSWAETPPKVNPTNNQAKSWLGPSDENEEDEDDGADENDGGADEDDDEDEDDDGADEDDDGAVEDDGADEDDDDGADEDDDGADEDDRNTCEGQISLGSLAGSTSVTRNLSIKNTNTL